MKLIGAECDKKVNYKILRMWFNDEHVTIYVSETECYKRTAVDLFKHPDFVRV